MSTTISDVNVHVKVIQYILVESSFLLSKLPEDFKLRKGLNFLNLVSFFFFWSKRRKEKKLNQILKLVKAE